MLSRNARSSSPRLLARVTAAMVALGLATSAVHAGEPRPEYEVKAAYLLNFTAYVEWPEAAFPDAGAPVVIGVLGRDPFGDLLERSIRGKTRGGRPVVARRFARIEEVDQCHVLYLGQAGRVQRAALQALSQRPVLTVGESERFLREGGAIRLLRSGDTVQFKVNLDATTAAGLKASSRMLALAREVIGSARTKGEG